MEDCANKILKSLFTLCLVLGSSVVGAQQVEFPYQALVISSDAKVHSGPGEMHYETEALAAGAMVQVHRHDPGGWCAIRPPKGSFSIIPATAIIVTDEHVGEVVEDGVQAWVGTGAGPVEKPLWQVKLKVGEEVHLLGEVSWPDPEGHSTSWYQIAAPSGEFRWIHLDDLQLPETKLPNDFETRQTQRQTVIGNYSPQAREQVVANQGWRPAKDAPKPSPEIRLASATQQEVDRGQSVHASGLSPFGEEKTSLGDGFVARQVNPDRFQSRVDAIPSIQSPRGIGPVRQQAGAYPYPAQAPQSGSGSRGVGPLPSNGFNPSSGSNQSAGSGNRPVRFADASTAFGGAGVGGYSAPEVIAPLGQGKLTTRLRELDMKLSREVIKPNTQWRLTELGFATQKVINSAVDDSERLAAERLLSKVNNFVLIQNGARQSNERADLERQNGHQTGASNQLANIYDAQGWLSELVQNRSRQETSFVLQDDSGRITHHVAAAPGLNLHRYLKSKVGIIGKRGFHQQLNLDHVLAERIIVLQK